MQLLSGEAGEDLRFWCQSRLREISPDLQHVQDEHRWVGKKHPRQSVSYVKYLIAKCKKKKKVRESRGVLIQETIVKVQVFLSKIKSRSCCEVIAYFLMIKMDVLFIKIVTPAL